MKIDTKAIQAELDALVNPVLTDTDGEPIPRRPGTMMKIAVKVDRLTSTVGLDETDHSYTIRLSRTKIHNQAQLDEKIAWVKKEIGGI